VHSKDEGEPLGDFLPRAPAPFDDPMFRTHRSETGAPVWISRFINRARNTEVIGVFSCIETLQGWLAAQKAAVPEEEHDELESLNEPMVVDHPDYGRTGEH